MIFKRQLVFNHDSPVFICKISGFRYCGVRWGKLEEVFEGFIVGGDELSFLSICKRARGDCGYQVE